MADFLTAIGDFLGLNKGNATEDAAKKNARILDRLETQGTGILDTGAAKVGGYLADSLDLASLGAGADGIYRDALGLGGDEGTARALAAFQGGPGYQFQMEQGLDALDRRAASRGMLQSGNNNLDTLRFSQGLADQEWDDWLGNLNFGINREMGSLGDLAQFWQGDMGNRLGLAGNIASGRTSANNQLAAGAEAGQGGLWDLASNVAGTVGAFVNPGNFFGTAPAAPAAPGATPTGYGRGFGWPI